MKDKVTEELKRVFRPEFLNRIDQSRLPRAGSRSTSARSSTCELSDVRNNLMLKGISWKSRRRCPTTSAEGFDPVFGARPLRRVIQNEIEDRLSEALLEGEYVEGDTVKLDYVDGKVVAEKAEPTEAEPPAEAVLTT